MARLHVEEGPDAGRGYDLRGDSTLGRGKECAVHLEDPRMSRAWWFL